jgi:hypothetical protein
MTGTWKVLTQQQRALAEQAFDALSTLDELAAANSAGESGERLVGFGDIYAYVNEPGRAMSASLREALEADARLRDALMRLLAKTAGYRCPRSAAAGTKALENRQGQGFAIRLRASRAEPSQVYVMIELLDPGAEAPKALFIAQHPDGLLKQALPEARGGTVQLLAEVESDLIRALRDPGSEVFLR